MKTKKPEAEPVALGPFYQKLERLEKKIEVKTIQWDDVSRDILKLERTLQKGNFATTSLPIAENAYIYWNPELKRLKCYFHGANKNLIEHRVDVRLLAHPFLEKLIDKILGVL